MLYSKSLKCTNQGAIRYICLIAIVGTCDVLGIMGCTGGEGERKLKSKAKIEVEINVMQSDDYRKFIIHAGLVIVITWFRTFSFMSVC